MKLHGTVPLYCLAYKAVPGISVMGAIDGSVVCVFIGSYVQNKLHNIPFYLS